MVVNQQVEVKFSIEHYEDVMLCDIVLMKACHILLGRPSLFDMKSIHNGHTNEITITHKERKFTLHPLTPSQVEEDQVQMRKKIKQEKDKKKSHDTYTHKSEIKCFKCQSSTHKSNESPNKRELMLKAKGLCED